MSDQSHIDAMREAIRGDLERARSRRPSIFERPAPPPVVTATPESVPEPVAEPAAEQHERPAPTPLPVPLPEPPPAAEAPPPERRVRDRLAFWRR